MPKTIPRGFVYKVIRQENCGVVFEQDGHAYSMEAIADSFAAPHTEAVSANGKILFHTILQKGVVAGLFIPQRVPKSLVADVARQKFGAGTALHYETFGAPKQPTT